MSAQADTLNPGHGGATLATRLRATAASEWIKFRSVRSGPAVLLGTAVIMLLGAWMISAGYRSGWPHYSAGDRAAYDPAEITMRSIELAQLLVGALGVMTVTGEYTSGLIRGTFIATPQRRQVLAMKALIFAAVVWAWCTALAFGAFLFGSRFLTSPVPHVSLSSPGVLTAVFGGGLYLTLVGLAGMFVGVLMRRTAAALAVLFSALGVLPVVLAMIPGSFSARLDAWLPTGAGGQIWVLNHSGQYTLGPWAGFAVFAAYVAATAAGAVVLIRKRDV